MTKKVYNKLVRDRIPEIIASDGATAKTRILDEDEYLLALAEKLIEEAREVRTAKTREERLKEMSDLREVMAAFELAAGLTENEIASVQKARAASRGKFEKRIYLEEVKE